MQATHQYNGIFNAGRKLLKKSQISKFIKLHQSILLLFANALVFLLASDFVLPRDT